MEHGKQRKYLFFKIMHLIDYKFNFLLLDGEKMKFPYEISNLMKNEKTYNFQVNKGIYIDDLKIKRNPFLWTFGNRTNSTN